MKPRFWKLFVLVLPALNSCFLMPKCEEYKASFLGKETDLVIQVNKSVGRELDFRGYGPITKKPITYNDTGGFYIYMIEATELGDTLVKKSNQTWFILKKKNINLKFDVQCDGEEYLKHKIDTLRKASIKYINS
ncbi:MAG: hypothetical protein ACRYG7_14065 [Janthinobacterium lividum]